VHGSRAHRLINGQSGQRPDGEPSAFPSSGAASARAIEALFLRAEGESALLERSWPANAQAEIARWPEAARRGARTLPTFCYRRPPVLTELRAALDWVAAGAGGALLEHFLLDRAAERRLPPPRALSELYAARAAELSLEAALAEEIGGRRFGELARQRHPVRAEPEWVAAERVAREWASAAEAPTTAPLFASDDARAPASLLNVLRELVGRLQLPVRVSVTRVLASRAASGGSVIYVRAGEQLSAAQALRIARHEVYAHAWPRARALAEPLGLARVGCAGAGADEEGRAVLLEQRFGDLDAERRRELGLRHLTALAVARGADAHECARELAAHGCEPERAIALYARCARGALAGDRFGGLCRELEYLPAWLRVSAAFSADPALEAWLAHGRWSLAAARRLGAHPSTSGAHM
jgi:hypothetical protein